MVSPRYSILRQTLYEILKRTYKDVRQYMSHNSADHLTIGTCNWSAHHCVVFLWDDEATIEHRYGVRVESEAIISYADPDLIAKMQSDIDEWLKKGFSDEG